MLKFNIITKPEKYFHQLVEVLRVFPPFSNLRKREREVFGEMLYRLHLLGENNNGIAERVLFDYKTKEEIATTVGISKANLYNIYKELREHDLITKDGINSKYRYRYLQHPEITFKFKGE
jgi:CRP-like cAMP-binding protein